MFFIWPVSNLAPYDEGWEDYYQTWMGVKYGAYGQFSAFMTGSVMANYNCFVRQQLPQLGWNEPGFNDIPGFHHWGELF